MRIIPQRICPRYNMRWSTFNHIDIELEPFIFASNMSRYGRGGRPLCLMKMHVQTKTNSAVSSFEEYKMNGAVSVLFCLENSGSTNHIGLTG